MVDFHGISVASAGAGATNHPGLRGEDRSPLVAAQVDAGVELLDPIDGVIAHPEPAADASRRLGGSRCVSSGSGCLFRCVRQLVGVAERALEDLGQAQPAALRYGVGQGLHEHLGVELLAGQLAALEGAARGEQLPQQGRFESAGGVAGVLDRAGHHITSRSASMAPAAFMACRTAMRSRGPTPRRLSAFTRSSTEVVAGRATAVLVDSFTSTVAALPCTVLPWEKGPGCETTGCWETAICSPPWATATGRMRTPWPATMVPVRSLTTMRARWSGSTSSASSWASRPTTLPLKAAGTLISMEAGSRA